MSVFHGNTQNFERHDVQLDRDRTLNCEDLVLEKMG